MERPVKSMGARRREKDAPGRLLEALRKEGAPLGSLTLSETISLAEGHGVAASDIAVAEAMASQGLRFGEVIRAVLDAFKFNLLSLEVGLSKGASFLLGRVGSELAQGLKKGGVLSRDRLIDKAAVYTLAAEVGNHAMGLQPCAGTGDSCVYTGLMKALLEGRASRERIGRIGALMLKIGTLFKEGKKTTGCNMEGYGAGAAVTAAALTEFRGGKPRDVARAFVLALSPTIGVPCTPRVIVSGLCATHIGGAVLVGDLASNLALKTSLPVAIDADVMLAMAAKIHAAAAPVITAINLDYMRPYFKRSTEVDRYVAEATRLGEDQQAAQVVERARREVRESRTHCQPHRQPLRRGRGGRKQHCRGIAHQYGEDRPRAGRGGRSERSPSASPSTSLPGAPSTSRGSSWGRFTALPRTTSRGTTRCSSSSRRRVWRSSSPRWRSRRCRGSRSRPRIGAP